MALLDLATGELLSDAGEAATLLEPTADVPALAEAASGNAGPIAIRFPAFGDGRGISLAVLLRERHGFTGEIRAVGYLIPDLAQFLLRSGFDTAEIADPEQAAIYLVLMITLGVLSIRKGHWVMFIIGIFFPLFWLIGAIMPPRRA